MVLVSVGPMGRRPALPIIVGALLFLISVGSLILTRGEDFISRIWLANAVLAAVMLRSSPRHWPGWAAVGFTAFIGAHLWCGDNPLHSIALAVLKLLEVLVVVVPLNRRFGTQIDLNQVRPLGLFLFLGGFLAPLVSGLGVEVYYLLVNGNGHTGLLQQWAVSHALGFLTVTPLLMAIPKHIKPAALAPRVVVESVLIIGLLAGVAALVYTQDAPLQATIIAFLVFAAFRLPTLAAAAAVVVVTGEAVLLTSLGYGPIAASQFDPQVRLVLLQAFIAVAGLVTLSVSAVIGERDRLLSAEIEARAAAESATNAKSAFLATMSHEIRTPLTGVLGMIDLLRTESREEERERFFAALKQSANLLVTVLDDILDFSKIESGNLELDDREFDLEELAQSTFDLFTNAASAKGILLTAQCDCPRGAWVHGDPVRLQQVMSNFVNNAIKFTEHGRVSIALRALPGTEGIENWRVEVRDTGIGIGHADRDCLFQPFVQADGSILRRFGGTGLGLAISRRLIEAMGGSIGVDSRLDRGSTFWFEVPLRTAGPRVARADEGKSAVPCRPLEILVAEDNPVNQMLIGALLRRMGHQTLLAGNGRVALEAARTQAFDCILMDMQMPEMDGLSATRAIRALPGQSGSVPIVALTADASSERRRFYDNIGLTDFLTKPVDPDQLAACLSAVASGPAPLMIAPSEAEAPALPLIDQTHMKQLSMAVGRGRFDKLLELLAIELVNRPAAMRRAIDDGDVTMARSEAHSLRGAASSIGATALSEAASAIELAEDTDSMTRAVDRLDGCAKQTHQAIDRLMAMDRKARGTG